MAKRIKVKIEKMGEFCGNLKIYRYLKGNQTGFLIDICSNISDHTNANIIKEWDKLNEEED